MRKQISKVQKMPPGIFRCSRFLLLLFVFLGNATMAQNTITFPAELSATPLQLVFEQVTKSAAVNFAYDSKQINLSQKVSVAKGKYSLKQLMDNLSAQANLTYQVSGNTVNIRPKNNGSIATISGRVLNQEGEGIAGATIQNLANNRSVLSSSTGSFSIEGNLTDQLRITHVGYAAVTVKADAFSGNSFLLAKTSENLSEVVVTSLGIRREKRALSYAVGSISGDEIDDAREPNLINSLEGKVPGLIISNTAGGPFGSSKVLIRGNTDITGSNQPLYVVDGVPIDNSNYGITGNDKYAAGSDLGDAISGINPDDIASISVLRGPAASALYGSRAGHGVILITTKKGSAGKGGLGVEINSSASMENLLTRYSNYQYEYGQGSGGTVPRDQAIARATLFSNFGARLDPNLMIPSYAGGNTSYGLVKNNIENFFRIGTSLINNVAITGGNDKTIFRFSYNNLHYSDIVPKTYMDRNSFTLRASTKLSSKLAVDVHGSYMNEFVNNRPALADDPANIGFNFVGLANNIDQQVFEKGYQDPFGNYIEWGGGQYHLNPYWVINRMSNKSNKDRVMGGLQLNYEPLQWLSAQARLNTDFTFLDYKKFSPRTTPGSETGVLEGRNSKYRTTNADVLLTAKKQLTKDFYGSVSLGGSVLYSNSPSTYKRGEDMLLTDAVSFNSFKKLSIQESAYEKQINSFYGTVSTGFKNFLYVDATLRRDASSTLPVKNNSYLYPSLGASFIATDALNIKSNILSYLKVRGSAAEVGNDTDPYQLLLNYSLEAFQPSDASIGGITNTIIPNPDLKPTRTKYPTGQLHLADVSNSI